MSILATGCGQVFAGEWLLGMTIGIGCFACVAVMQAGFSFLPLTPATAMLYFAAAFTLAILQLGIAADAARRAWRNPVLPPRPWYKTTWIANPVLMLAFFSIVPLGKKPYELYHVPNGTDAPTIEVGDIILADKGRIAPQDVIGKLIAFRIGRGSAIYLKRVVGLPGDTVQMQNGRLSINGTLVPREFVAEESQATPGGGSIIARRYHETLPGGSTSDILKYTDDPQRDYSSLVDPNNTAARTVPPNCLFVLGDNRDDSLDSRFPSFGVVPADHVVAVVRVIVWSPHRRRIMMDVR